MCRWPWAPLTRPKIGPRESAGFWVKVLLWSNFHPMSLSLMF